MELSEYLLIGRVLRPQGIRGLVKVMPETDDPERYYDLERVFIRRNGAYAPVSVSNVQVRSDGVYLSLDDAEDRNTAEKQRGWELFIDRAHAVELGEDENFICDLIGCTVYDGKGREIGRVTDVLQPGANDVYVIKTPEGELLAPALKKVFPEVNVKEGRITADETLLSQVSVMSE